MDALSRGRCGCRLALPNRLAVQRAVSTPVFCADSPEEISREMRTRNGHEISQFGRNAIKPALLLAAPQGFEPRYADPESAVLPLNEGAGS
jgi:hypothetical protein